MNIIAVDIGTSRIKTACFDETGAMRGLLGRRLDRASSPEIQEAEQWFDAASLLLRQLTADLSVSPDAVVLTGNMHALLGIDADGKPVAPAVLWSDNSAQAESDELNARYGKILLERFGNRSIPVFTLPKILRMKRLAPDLYRRTATFMQSKDYIAFRLTGNRVTDPTDASGVLGMDLRTNTWTEDFFDDLQLDIAKLPAIVPSNSVCGHVTAEAAARTGLPQGLPVVVGTGDLASAAVGSSVDPDTISLTLGTAGQLLAAGKKGTGGKLAGQLFIFAHADPEQELYLGSVPSGGFSFEWLAHLHNISVPEFFELAGQVALSADFPLFKPYILGKGAPSMDYTPCGAWQDLRAGHTLADLCRGAVFGTLCPLRQCADLLEKVSGRRMNLILQALACREKAVRETACALFAQRKFIPENSEASLLGAAMVGAVTFNLYPDLSSAAAVMVKKRQLDFPADPVAQALFERFLGE
ncbi:MAG: hypothetical protein J5806_04795 [Lentisphaeria bacterium]|nr:hypothetical protein [Lentisphaeria bacterium]